MNHSRFRSTQHAVAALLLAVLPGALPFAQNKPPPQPKPITREWTCENGRIVLVNYHPRRIREPAWLTYLGNRIEVTRKRVDAGIAASSADGKVSWHERGSAAQLEFAGLLDQPLQCESRPKPAGK